MATWFKRQMLCIQPTLRCRMPLCRTQRHCHESPMASHTSGHGPAMTNCELQKATKSGISGILGGAAAFWITIPQYFHCISCLYERAWSRILVVIATFLLVGIDCGMEHGCEQSQVPLPMPFISWSTVIRAWS
jgi:hypothetical protein